MKRKTEKKPATASPNASGPQVRQYANWYEIKQRYFKTPFVAERLAMLEHGFTNHGNDFANTCRDRIDFYLCQAEPRSLVGFVDDHILADKAFEMLVQHCFVPFTVHANFETNRYGFEADAECFGTGQSLLPALSKLFYVSYDENTGKTNKVNIPSLQSECTLDQTVISFLTSLAEYIWDKSERLTDEIDRFDAGKREESVAECVRIQSFMPWMIEILVVLKRLDILEEYNRIINLTSDCLAKLSKIAMRSYLHPKLNVVKESRLVKSLREARLVNSPCAWLCEKNLQMKLELTRLANLTAAARELETAQKKLQQLSALE